MTVEEKAGHWLFADKAYQLLRHTVRSFVDREIVASVEDWEEAGEVPREVFRRCGELGFFGLKFPEKYGGLGEDWLAEAVFSEELNRCGSGGVAAALGSHSNLGTLYVYETGNEEQKQRWLVPAIKGEKISALAITEPNAGSDVVAIETTAERHGDCYVINGTKLFITNGPRADFVVVAAKTDISAGHRGISLIVVERGTPGFSAKKMDKLCWRASDTGELVFSDCRVPIANLLGDVNRGFYYIMQEFVWERLLVALGSVGDAQLALETALKYAQERVQFGQPIAKFQVTQHKLADMATEVELARALTYHALALYVKGKDVNREASMAKLLATEVRCRVTDEAVQIHGGYGYMMEYPVQRYWRDAMIGTIGGGTSEIMKGIIAASLGLGEKA